jgi:hypothetical protein
MKTLLNKTVVVSMLLFVAGGVMAMPMQSHALTLQPSQGGIVFDEPNPIRVVGEN